MLFSKEFKAAIRAGEVTRTYRTWKRPQAKAGGRYNLAPDGVIEVRTMIRTRISAISDSDAIRAGFADAAALKAYLDRPDQTEVYQIDFRYLGAGLIRQPLQDRLDDTELAAIQQKLTRMDDRADAAWTRRALAELAEQPGIRAADLAPAFEWDTATFKKQIRKLKALGLTVSLETGYRLSERGRQVLAQRGAADG